MAVTNFHYITRMSSGFKVYILEGQPHLRSEDRFRHTTNDRIRVTAAYPFKHKYSSEQRRTLEERRERALSKSLMNAERTSRLSMPESPTSTWSPTASPASLNSNTVIDEPLALVKKMHQETEDKNNKTEVRHIQIRPSVITCASTKSACMPVACCEHITVLTQHSYDNVEEHFQRSLGVNYQKGSTKQVSIGVSVDDHFTKALGEKWLELKASSFTCSSSSTQSTSSSCPCNPTFSHSLDYDHSPKRAHKRCVSPTIAPSSIQSGK